MYHYCCQTILFSKLDVKKNMDEVLSYVAAAGYDSVESAVRFYDFANPGYYTDLYAKYKLDLCGLHIAGDFHDTVSVDAQMSRIPETIVFARKIGARYIYLSGRKTEEREVFESEARKYAEFGKMCSDAGIVMCYHNHFWEFKNNGLGMKILMDRVPAEHMKLVPDIGMIYDEGFDPARFMKENTDRVESVHFKISNDLGSMKETPSYFGEVAEYIKNNGRDDYWITVEQGSTQIDPKEAAVINLKFVKGLMK